ncbi:hypothetical protein HGA34_01820 [Candidatus Falkowbacteria bacterium]|nr:hypothetical protein [Candidatus Falkowbacteria bacterium]
MKKIIMLSLAVVLIATGCTLGGKRQVVLKPNEAQAKAEKFINEVLLGGQQTATLANFALDADTNMYKFEVSIPGNSKPIEAYLTKDGKTFFPQSLNLEEIEKQAAGQGGDQSSPEQKKPSAVAPKSDKPKVELFVMSYCPYGTQIEKGIIPVVEKLGESIDFNLKFVNYAMHDEKEIKENLLQYCIDKEDNSKLLPYLKCFLKSDESAKCLAEVKVNTGKVNACVKSSDEKFQVTEKYKNKEGWTGQFPPFDVHKADNEKYGVQGSPSLVINGEQISSGRSPSELLKTICSAFNKAPAACSTELSSAEPAPGFGDGTTQGGSTGAAGCGQ